MMGQQTSQLIPDDRADELPLILSRIARGEHVVPYETVRLRKDGMRIGVALTVSPIKDESGSVIGASTIAREITERTKLDSQVRQSQEMDAVGSPAGGTAHRLHNILPVRRAPSPRLPKA